MFFLRLGCFAFFRLNSNASVGGVLAKLKKQGGESRWAFIAAGVGDTKIFHWSKNNPKGSKVLDITENMRALARDDRGTLSTILIAPDL